MSPAVNIVRVVIVALLIAITAGVMPRTLQVAEASERPYFGPVIIDPTLGDWDDFQRRLFRAGGFDLAKVHLPHGFNTGPWHVEDLIADGATVIMLKTEDCYSVPWVTRWDLVERGFIQLVDRYPDVRFVIQVGNEPELCDVPMDVYIQGQVATGIMLRNEFDRPNLEWIAGLPMSPSLAKDVVDNSLILRYFDGVGTNMLGHFSLVDERHTWHEIVEHVLENSDANLWITEIGINHPPMPKEEKARRILAYVDQLPPDRVQGVAKFALSAGSAWPQYELDQHMVPVFAERENCYYFVATGYWLCDEFKAYWDEYGGLAIFGYPIVDVFQDENGRDIQYLERNRFEHHPGVWPEKHDVLLGHLGWWHADDRAATAEFQSVGPDDDCVYFEATGQNLCDEFLEYWDEFGGLPIFGYPISQRFFENGVVVQYLERARFEHHPGVWPERFDVLQGHLGIERYAQIQAEGGFID